MKMKPPMNTDEHRSKLSVFICVHRWLVICRAGMKGSAFRHEGTKRYTIYACALTRRIDFGYTLGALGGGSLTSAKWGCPRLRTPRATPPLEPLNYSAISRRCSL